MKIVTIVLFPLIAFIHPSFSSDPPVNDVTRLKETIYSFGKSLSSGEAELPASFQLTIDEYRKMMMLSGENYSDEQILKNHQYITSKSAAKFSELKRDRPYLADIISFDTVSYQQENLPSIDISIIYRNKEKATIINLNKTTRVLISFVIVNNQLKLVGSLRTVSDFHYDLHVMERIKSARKNELRKRYSERYFNSSTSGVIPFRKNAKWGLVSDNGEIMLAAKYDSIFPYRYNYATVVLNGRYNLIDTNYKEIFPLSKKQIRDNEEGYLIPGEDGVYQSFPEKKPEPEIKGLSGLDETRNIGALSHEEPDKTDKTINKALSQKLSEEYYGEKNYLIRRTNDPGSGASYHFVIRKTGDTLSTHYGYVFIDGHGDYLIGKRNDSTIAMDLWGKIIFKSVDVCKMESPGFVDVFNKGKRLFGIYCPYTGVYIKPQYKYIQAIDRDRFFVVITEQGQLGYLDHKGKKLF